MTSIRSAAVWPALPVTVNEQPPAASGVMTNCPGVPPVAADAIDAHEPVVPAPAVAIVKLVLPVCAASVVCALAEPIVRNVSAAGASETEPGAGGVVGDGVGLGLGVDVGVGVGVAVGPAVGAAVGGALAPVAGAPT